MTESARSAGGLNTKIGLVSGTEASVIDDAKEVVVALHNKGADVILENKIADALDRRGVGLRKIDADVITVVGSDRFLLRTLLQLGSTNIPILPISSKGQMDFLFDVTAANFSTTVTELLDGNWTKDRRARLTAEISGKKTPPLLNDLALFAKRSATLIRYTLYLDDEEFWKDGSDGLIIATPTGSTAYSMSVGGPIVLNPSGVITVLPVNSVNPALRPLVVPDSVTIRINDLSSHVAVEAVLDGQLRWKVDSTPVVIQRADSDTVFVKFSQERVAALRGKLLRKTEVYEGPARGLPPSAKLVLKILEYQGYLTQKQIIAETLLPSRTVRHALSILITEGFVKKRTSLRDSRQGLYGVIKKPTKDGPK